VTNEAKGAFLLLLLYPITTTTMKVVLSVLALAATASAFAPSASVVSRGLVSSVATATPTQLFSEPEGDDEEEGLDLNLEEMFDMYVGSLSVRDRGLSCIVLCLVCDSLDPAMTKRKTGCAFIPKLSHLFICVRSSSLKIDASGWAYGLGY
jgi:hypothetical protein